MMKNNKQLVIIGGGPAGIAAAIAAKKAGIDDLLILERDQCLGGILNQCIHNGFGLHTFGEELTGPEYAWRYIEQVNELNIPYELNSMVLDITPDKEIRYVNSEEGVKRLRAKAIILAMGCRERPAGALSLPGDRPAGIYSAGTAQKLVNIDGLMPGQEVVILGSGDIGLIMARRMTFEGAHVHTVAELMPYSGGLKRNIVQCLDDFDIPLQLSHTVTNIKGKDRVESVTIAKVDENRKPIPGTEIEYPCDTLLLSCGLIPENELSQKAGIELSRITQGPRVNELLETNVEGIFACGNVLHVHDLVDFVSQEATKAGENAAEYIRGSKPASGHEIPIETGGLVRYTVPFEIDPLRMDKKQTVRFRVANVQKGGYVNVYVDDKRLIHRKKKIMAPGEMESIVLNREWLDENSQSIRIETEAE